MKKDEQGTLWMHTGDEGIMDHEGYLQGEISNQNHMASCWYPMEVVGRIKVRVLFNSCLTSFPNWKFDLGYHYSRRRSKFLPPQYRALLILSNSEFIPRPNWECIDGASRNSWSSSCCCPRCKIWWSSRCLDCPRATYAHLERWCEELRIQGYESSSKNYVLRFCCLFSLSLRFLHILNCLSS